jgi:hypothetical protein
MVETMRAHRETLDRVMDRRGVKSLRKLYDRSQQELVRKLDRTIKSGKKDTMTALQMHQMLVQVREGQARIAASMANGLKPVLRDTQSDAIRQAAGTIRRLEKLFTGAEVSLPIEEAALFADIQGKRMPSLIRANAASFQRYGSTVTSKIEEQLALSLMTGETPYDAMERVEETADTEFWRAERIVRTETAYAFNASHADSIAAAAEELPDLYQRWSEHVDDTTGQPLDDRVAEDSLVLHGQVTKPGQMFVMPPDPRVSPKMWNQQYENPPNRPNDRAVLLPWRPDWGVAGWSWRNGQRVNITG